MGAVLIPALRLSRLIGSVTVISLLALSGCTPVPDRGARPESAHPSRSFRLAFGRGGPDTTTYPGDVVVPRNPEIYVGTADGSGLVNLTSSEAIDTDPAWSPDGRAIAFVRAVPGDIWPPTFSLFAVAPDGTRLRRLTRCVPPRCPGDGSITWSPDGSTIAFVRGSSIHAVDVSSRTVTLLYAPHRLTGLAGLSCSPDGSAIAFSALAVGTGPDGLPTASGRPQLFALDVHGGGVRRLTRCPEPSCAGDVEPAWSPDGSRIAFTRQRPDGGRDLYLLELTTGRLARVHACRPPECQEGGLQPAWSPDGSHLAFVVGGPLGGDIRLVDTAGRAVVTVTSGPMLDCCPSFDPSP